jgi:hypothetical protein
VGLNLINLNDARLFIVSKHATRSLYTAWEERAATGRLTSSSSPQIDPPPILSVVVSAGGLMNVIVMMAALSLLRQRRGGRGEESISPAVRPQDDKNDTEDTPCNNTDTDTREDSLGISPSG